MNDARDKSASYWWWNNGWDEPTWWADWSKAPSFKTTAPYPTVSYDAHLAASEIIVDLSSGDVNIESNNLEWVSRSRLEKYTIDQEDTMVSQAERIDVVSGSAITKPYTEIRARIGKTSCFGGCGWYVYGISCLRSCFFFIVRVSFIVATGVFLLTILFSFEYL